MWYPPKILGYSWLRRQSPCIDWATGVSHVWGTSYHQVSLSIHHPHHPYMSQSLWVQVRPGCLSNTTTSGLSSARPRPLHCHNIDSTTVRLTSSLAHGQLGAIFTHCPLQRMATETNITKALAAGILCPSSSPLFFVKMDISLRPWIDHRGVY